MIELNIEKILQPISLEVPSGFDLRKDTSVDSLYYRIKDARNLARDLERQQAMGGELSLDEKPRWDKLLNLCIEALETQTKDLEVASFLIEALLREEGFMGLMKGFQITQNLIEKYWGKIYPLPDEEGFEIRLAFLNSLNGEDYEGTLIRPIYHQLITQGNSVGPYALWQYQQALDNMKVQDKDLIERKRGQGSVFIQEIQTAVKESKPVFYEELIGSILTAKMALEDLSKTIEAKCGIGAFATSKILSALDFFNEHVGYLLKEAPFKLKEISPEAKERKKDENLIVKEKQPVESISLKELIGSRDEALMTLGKVADFFRITEPQSPLPYLLERSINLGRLSFPELLKALVSDEGARRFSYELLGIE